MAPFQDPPHLWVRQWCPSLGHEKPQLHLLQCFCEMASSHQFDFEGETKRRESADIKIGFFSRSHGDGSPFDGRGEVLAHAYEPTVGVVHFDADDRWAINPSSKELFDVETVAVLEIGHVLGLDHSNDPNARMYPTAHGGQSKVELGADDIQGIRTLYGF